MQVSFPNLWASGAYLIAVSTGYSLPALTLSAAD